jgi:hypothetical protein
MLEHDRIQRDLAAFLESMAKKQFNSSENEVEPAFKAKVRKSNFDLLPQDMPSTAIAASAEDIIQRLYRGDISEAFSSSQWVPATDASFVKRLDNAMIKNF